MYPKKTQEDTHKYQTPVFILPCFRRLGLARGENLPTKCRAIYNVVRKKSKL